MESIGYWAVRQAYYYADESPMNAMLVEEGFFPDEESAIKELEGIIRNDWTTEVERTNERGETWAVPLADLRGYQSDSRSIRWSEVYYSEDGKCAWVQHSTGTTYRAEVVEVIIENK